MTLRWLMMISVLSLTAAAGAGCHEPTGPRTVANPDPAVKVPAIKHAVAERDLGAAAAMVTDLESDDAAVRLFAIQGLRRLTGEAFGYDYYADPKHRAPAVERWKQWLASQQRR